MTMKKYWHVRGYEQLVSDVIRDRMFNDQG